MKKRMLLIKTLMAMLAFFGTLFITSGSTFALSEDVLYVRALLNQMDKCYSYGLAQGAIVDNYSTLLTFSDNLLVRKDMKLYIPTEIGIGNELKQQSEGGTIISCKELFEGDPYGSGLDGTMRGLFDLYNRPLPQNGQITVVDFLKNMGYTKDPDDRGLSGEAMGDNIDTGGGEGSTGRTCLVFKHGMDSSILTGYTPEEIGKVCWSNSKLDSQAGNMRVEFDDVLGDGIMAEASGYVQRVDIDYVISPNGLSFGVNADVMHGETLNEHIICTLPDKFMGRGEFNSTNIRSVALARTGAADRGPYGCEGYGYAAPEYYYGDVFWAEVVPDDEVEPAPMRLWMESPGKAYSIARKWMHQDNGETKNWFGDKEKYDLYMIYLRKVYGAQIDSLNCSDSKPGETGFIHVAEGWCKVVVPTENTRKTVSGFSVGEGYFMNTYFDFDQLVAAIGNLNVNDNELGTIDVVPTPGNVPTANTETTCLNSGAAESLGWIMCTVLDVVAGASEWLYDNAVEPSLRVEPELFTNGGQKSGTRIGWETFRNFANILFVVFLLIVIFSQLTGVGIDNYGIKKILPKLIVIAVLINLSYFICQALVDLSNILGNALQALFEGLDSGVNDKMTVWEGVKSIGSTFAITGLMAAIGGTAIWALVSGSGAAGMLIGLVLAAVSALVSLLFLFIILAARKMAIVVLVVLSPLALVCYALPNTKPLFDKYKKLGMNLLMVYPIAGILVGGGDYVSRLMLTVGDKGSFIAMLTAMIAGIVPIFFIPTVLRNSMSMMGSLGAKISGFGQNMGRRFTGNLDRGIRGTNRYRNYQDRLAGRRQEREAQRVHDRYHGRTGLTRDQQERLAKANDTLLARDRQAAENREKVSAGYYNAASNKNMLDVQQSAEDMRLYGDPRVVIAEQTKGDNSRTMRREEAAEGITPVNPADVRRQIQARKRAEAVKNYASEFDAMDDNALKAAAATYQAGGANAYDGTEESALHLSALMQTLESRGMEKQMMNVLDGLTFTSGMNNGSDDIVRGHLSGSKVMAVSTYGKKGSGLSFNDFITTTTPGQGLHHELQQMGENALTKFDHDSLDFMNTKGFSGASPDMMVRGALNPQGGKELTSMINMIKANGGAAGAELSAHELGSITSVDLLNALDKTTYGMAALKLEDGSDESRQILARMNEKVRGELRIQGYKV